MQLCDKDLNQSKEWLEKGYQLPRYSRPEMCAYTRENPIWLHFGAGNLFRGFIVSLQDELLNKGVAQSGIVACESYDIEMVEKVLKPCDNLCLQVVLNADGTIEKRVLGSIADSISANSSDSEEWGKLKSYFCSPSLQIVSFTITEKGYSLKDGFGNYFKAVKEDFVNGPLLPKSLMGMVASLCYERFKSGGAPLALLSLDNCSHNGSRLFEAVNTYARKWLENGFVRDNFVKYIQNPELVSFPWSMIDRITPAPNEKVALVLQQDGFESTEIIYTSKNTAAAPFVNTEQAFYLVIEDSFPNGRPPLELAGVLLTGRDTVDKAETMKVCTCLNPLHTALAIFGCLLGFKSISSEMQDETLREFVWRLGIEEELPVAVDPKILNPRDFLYEALNLRLPNPFIPDTPQRIASDTSQKMPIRFGKALQAYVNKGQESVLKLRWIPLVIAGWLRYLLGINDEGQPFELSPDPMLPVLLPAFSGIELGRENNLDKIRELLRNKDLFAVDLYEIGLDVKIEEYFIKMLAGPGSVKGLLCELLNQNG
ncbi:MAG TPA: mannitol dehydrogenase family protein [Candidatus Avimonas sp.]|jgi:fructuronate reductase|nr:mannitol dehydrogenase family protein [Candidatus Avimonas sp.]HQD38448.1 mannitol dehydrogenase family protein [Candidatus Avimonas sp.]